MQDSPHINLVVSNVRHVSSGGHAAYRQVTSGSSGDDNSEKVMSEVSREEMNAKLEAVESRLDAKLAGISADIRVLASAVGDIKGEIGNLRNDVQEVKADNKNTRTTIIITIIGSILAAGAALWSTQSNLLAAFQSGIELRQSTAQPLERSEQPPVTR